MSRPEGHIHRARLLWGCVLAALLGFLILAPKPWAFPTGPDFFGPVDRPLSHAAWIGLWWAALPNAILALLFLVSTPLWAGGAAAPDVRYERPLRRRGFVVLLCLAALLAGGLRWNLAGTGLWSDEAWTVKHTMGGYLHPARDGSPRLDLDRPGWKQTLWLYYQPTNQVLYSVVGRTTLSTWRWATGRQRPDFDERVVRLPALLAAMGAVVALGLLLAEWGFPAAGAAAAFGLAIHPWFIRFGADARAYSAVVLFAILACLFLTRALRSGHWRHWLRYGVVLFLMLWGHLFSAYLVVTLALGGLAALITIPGYARSRWTYVGRLVVVNAAAVMLVFQLMAPNLTQLDRWRGIFIGDVQTAHLTLPALGHVWALAAVGMEAREPRVRERVEGRYPSLAQGPWPAKLGYGVVLFALPLLTGVGLLTLVSHAGPVRYVALGLATALPLALFFNWLNQDQWYSRFGVYALPGTVGFAALGLQVLLLALPWPRRLGAWPVLAGLALGVLGFQAFVWPQTRLLQTRPHTPSRQVSELFQRELGPGPEGGIRAAFGNVAGEIVLGTYEPWLRVATDTAQVEALCREARSSGQPLLLAYGHPDRNRRNHPDLFKLLDDPELFEEVALFDAIEVEHLMRVLRYTGRPLPR